MKMLKMILFCNLFILNIGCQKVENAANNSSFNGTSFGWGSGEKNPTDSGGTTSGGNDGGGTNENPGSGAPVDYPQGYANCLMGDDLHQPSGMPTYYSDDGCVSRPEQNTEYTVVIQSATWCGPCSSLKTSLKNNFAKYDKKLTIRIAYKEGDFTEAKVDSTLPFFQAVMLKADFYGLGGTAYPSGFMYKNGVKVKNCGAGASNISSCIDEYIK